MRQLNRPAVVASSKSLLVLLKWLFPSACKMRFICEIVCTWSVRILWPRCQASSGSTRVKCLNWCSVEAPNNFQCVCLCVCNLYIFFLFQCVQFLPGARLCVFTRVYVPKVYLISGEKKKKCAPWALILVHLAPVSVFFLQADTFTWERLTTTIAIEILTHHEGCERGPPSPRGLQPLKWRRTRVGQF